VASVSSSAWELNFDSDAEALQWARKAMDKSGFVSRYSPTESDVYITLSTCSYEFNNARFVLTGVLK
jgi:sortase B